MTAQQRTLCLHSIYGTLSSEDISEKALLTEAVELEHAAYIYAELCPVAYPFSVLRVLHLLDQGKLQKIRGFPHLAEKSRAYIELLNLSSHELHTALPCQEECIHTNQLRTEGENLLRNLGRHELTHVPNAGTRCAKCNSSDIAFDFLQTRSADEGTTVYCTCTSCGKRWKM
uniref:TFIIS-type domain-containing protein n=1 Tax=viral metagenome TaxID=1070528 RepID=A0A6C0C283_9ZZZZ